MQHGMHNTIELMKVENALIDQHLKYHYLIADERLRRPKPAILANFGQSIRAFLAPRQLITHERGI